MPARALPAAEVRERFESIEERVAELEERSDVWSLLQMITETRERLKKMEGGSRRSNMRSKRSGRRKKSRG